MAAIFDARRDKGQGAEVWGFRGASEDCARLFVSTGSTESPLAGLKRALSGPRGRERAE